MHTQQVSHRLSLGTASPEPSSHLDWLISPSCQGGISHPSEDSLCQFLDGSPLSPNPLFSSLWVCSHNLVKHTVQGLPEEGLMGTWKAVARPDVIGPPLVTQEAAELVTITACEQGGKMTLVGTKVTPISPKNTSA